MVLLNTLGKVLETIVTSRITALSEDRSLLLPQHMGACPERSTYTAVDMLIKQSHAAWQADDEVDSLLSLDMTEAYDRVVSVLLICNLRKKCIPQWLVKFISSFLSDRSTSLGFCGFSSSPFLSEQGVP